MGPFKYCLLLIMVVKDQSGSSNEHDFLIKTKWCKEPLNNLLIQSSDSNPSSDTLFFRTSALHLRGPFGDKCVNWARAGGMRQRNGTRDPSQSSPRCLLLSFGSWAGRRPFTHMVGCGVNQKFTRSQSFQQTAQLTKHSYKVTVSVQPPEAQKCYGWKEGMTGSQSKRERTFFTS